MPLDTTVGREIERQIGPKAFAMMGTGNQKWIDHNCLIFDIKGCRKWRKIRVTLDADDTYTVAFFQIDRACRVTSKEVRGVYCDMLHQIIEAETGLCLSL
jgi:hypothetical protein